MNEDKAEKILDDYIEKTYTFSSQDKLDWDNVIELLMKLCIFARGTKHHHKWVKRLESAVNTDFSGVNIRDPMKDNLERIEREKDSIRVKMISECDDGIYYHPLDTDDLTCMDKDIIKDKVYDWYWEERFAFVRDFWAMHRGLIWGKKSTPGGKPMKRDE
jgi:hypothetical protein